MWHPYFGQNYCVFSHFVVIMEYTINSGRKEVIIDNKILTYTLLNNKGGREMINKKTNFLFSRVVIIITALVLILSGIISVSAMENTEMQDNCKIIMADISNKDEINKKVLEAFEDESITHVQVIDPTLLEEDEIILDDNKPNITPFAIGFLYKATNVKKLLTL